MPSCFYQTTIETGQVFHKKYPKKWSGDSTVAYKEHIKRLVIMHQAKTLLDYGCGKALHYQKDSIFNFGSAEKPLTFDQYIEIDNFYRYDPCVPEYSTLPPKNKKFDAVIAVQCLSLVPDDDMPWVKDLLQSYTGKFCFIANQDPQSSVSARKAELTSNTEYFKAKRTKEWYLEQFKDWQGSELILFFQPRRDT